MYRAKFILIAGCIFVLGTAEVGWAYSFSGSWQPNSDDVHLQDLTPESGNVVLGLFSPGYDPAQHAQSWQDYLMLAAVDGVTGGDFTSSTVFFRESGGEWNASLDPGGNHPQWWGNSRVGSGGAFLLAFIHYGFDTNGGLTIEDIFVQYDVRKTGEDSFLLTSPRGWQVALFDAAPNPVPLPAAVYMFASGMAGLIVFGGRSRRRTGA